MSRDVGGVNSVCWSSAESKPMPTNNLRRASPPYDPSGRPLSLLGVPNLELDDRAQCALEHGWVRSISPRACYGLFRSCPYLYLLLTPPSDFFKVSKQGAGILLTCTIITIFLKTLPVYVNIRYYHYQPSTTTL
jgi:hypothetical protein